MSYAKHEMNVIQWGVDRGIVQNGTPAGQAGKTAEEATELVDAMARITLLRELSKSIHDVEYSIGYTNAMNKAKADAKDAIGDVLVTLIMSAATIDVDVTECLELAYNEIKDRKGYLRADGVFVKESA